MPAWEHSWGIQQYAAAAVVEFVWFYYHIFAAAGLGSSNHVHLTIDVALTRVVFGWVTSLAL